MTGVIDIAKTEFGKELAQLAGETVREVHRRVVKEKSFERVASLSTYILNENMVFMQFVELLLDIHVKSLAHAVEKSQE